jgi:hypothetical protein
MVLDKIRIKDYFLDFNKRGFEEVIEREVGIKENSKISALIGSRRVGKTYLMFNEILKLEKKGILREQILYINFENPIFNKITDIEIKDLIDIHWSIFKESIDKKIYLFIDEPQEINGWEKAVRSLYDNFNCKIFITGSSSKLLSKEIATSLRGRAISINVYSLNFSEFLTFKNFKYDLKKLNSKDKAKLINYFEEFLKYGGFPEIIFEKNKIEKLKISKDYFDLIIYKDLVDRYKIKNVKMIKWLIDYFVNSNTKEINLNKIFFNLKSQGVNISKNTLYEYFNVLSDSFFILPLKKFDHSPKRQKLYLEKVFLNDVSFMNLFNLKNYGQRLENLVYLELLSKINNNPLMKINYWKSKNNFEVDFVISNGKNINQLIQVCYDYNEKDKDREIKGLIESMQEFNLKKGLILTLDQEEEFSIEGKKIIVKPVWKWALT